VLSGGSKLEKNIERAKESSLNLKKNLLKKESADFGVGGRFGWTPILAPTRHFCQSGVA
jgi:hypothetical protein